MDTVENARISTRFRERLGNPFVSDNPIDIERLAKVFIAAKNESPRMDLARNNLKAVVDKLRSVAVRVGRPNEPDYICAHLIIMLTGHGNGAQSGYSLLETTETRIAAGFVDLKGGFVGALAPLLIRHDTRDGSWVAGAQHLKYMSRFSEDLTPREMIDKQIQLIEKNEVMPGECKQIVVAGAKWARDLFEEFYPQVAKIMQN